MLPSLATNFSLANRNAVMVDGGLHSRVCQPSGERVWAGEGDAGVRHGSNPGAARLAGQRVPIRVPRVRGDEGEIPGRAHAALRGSGEVEDRNDRRQDPTRSMIRGPGVRFEFQLTMGLTPPFHRGVYTS